MCILPYIFKLFVVSASILAILCSIRWAVKRDDARVSGMSDPIVDGMLDRFDIRRIDVLPEGTEVLITIGGIARHGLISGVDFDPDFNITYDIDLSDDPSHYCFGVTADQFTVFERPGKRVTLVIETPKGSA